MPDLKRFLLALFTVTLLDVSIPGCAQNELAMKKSAQSVDCRSCHASNGVAGAKDFSSIYANPASHHVVGVIYPLGSNAYPKFNAPNAQSRDIAFFDTNGNGRPDSDEIQLFGTSIAAMVECASCHREHGDSPASDYALPNDLHLRIANIGSALCITCHRQ